MTINEKNKVIDKIKKLIALSTSPNENEAAAAAAKVQAILAEHNLSMVDVKSTKESGDKVEEDRETKTHSFPWQRTLANVVGRMYFTRHFYTTHKKPGGNARSGHDVHHFVGEPHNIAVAKVMFMYLVETVERLAREGAKNYPERRSSYITSFQNAASGRLYTRIMERIEAAKRGEIKNESTGKNLPALLNLYEQTDLRLQGYMDKAHPELRTVRTRTRSGNSAGYQDGIAAGNKIGLDQQVGRNHQSSKMLTH